MSWKAILAIDLGMIVVYTAIAVALRRAIPGGMPEQVYWGAAAGLVIGGLRLLAIRSLGNEVNFAAFQESAQKSFWGRAANAASAATVLLMVLLTLLRSTEDLGFRILLGLLVAHVVREAMEVYPTYRLAHAKEREARAGRRGHSGVPSGEHDHQRSE